MRDNKSSGRVLCAWCGKGILGTGGMGQRALMAYGGNQLLASLLTLWSSLAFLLCTYLLSKNVIALSDLVE